MTIHSFPSLDKHQQIPECPACSCVRGREVKPLVYECGKCNALFSNHLYLGESYSFVLPFMSNETSIPDERLRYFDFSGVGSNGPYRRHGWFDTQTKTINRRRQLCRWGDLMDADERMNRIDERLEADGVFASDARTPRS